MAGNNIKKKPSDNYTVLYGNHRGERVVYLNDNLQAKKDLFLKDYSSEEYNDFSDKELKYHFLSEHKSVSYKLKLFDDKNEVFIGTADISIELEADDSRLIVTGKKDKHLCFAKKELSNYITAAKPLNVPYRQLDKYAQMITKAKEQFELFTGENTVTVYAHNAPSLIDPSDEYDEAGRKTFVAEIFTKGIIDHFDNKKSDIKFPFSYYFFGSLEGNNSVSEKLESSDIVKLALKPENHLKNDQYIKGELRIHMPVPFDCRGKDKCGIDFAKQAYLCIDDSAPNIDLFSENEDDLSSKDNEYIEMLKTLAGGEGEKDAMS